jgi:hypothetical protein
MGLGDAFSSVFGGNNSFKATPSPVMGGPKQPGETDQAYQQRIYGEYQQQLGGFQNQQLNPNALNMSQANQTGQAQSQLAGQLGQGMRGNINFGAANQTLGQNQGLINQLMAQSQGLGPNPAMDQLRMTTDANIRNQTAQTAGARGINPALAARIAAQSGAATQQGAAGQAALQSAQQQLGAQGQAGQLIGQQAGLQTQMAGMNAQQQQQYAALLAQALGQQRGQDIGQSATQGQAGLGLMGNQNQAALGYMGLQNQAYAGANGINAGVSAQNANTNFQYGQQGLGMLQGLAQGAMMAINKGGEVPEPFVDAVRSKGMRMAGGGLAQYQAFQGQDPLQAELGLVGGAPTADLSGMGQGLGKYLKGVFASGPQMGSFDSGAAMGGSGDLAMASTGGQVDGRAKAQGDSIKNDTVPALLSPGEIVIPRSAATDAQAAHAFLDKILAQKRVHNYSDVVRAQELINLWHGGCAGG